MEIDSSIEVFQAVSFKCPRDISKLLRAKLKESINPPWQLDPGWEREVKSRSNGDAEIIAFSRESID